MTCESNYRILPRLCAVSEIDLARIAKYVISGTTLDNELGFCEYL